MKKTDLQIKTGAIAELCQEIRKAKAEYNKHIEVLNNDSTYSKYSKEYKEELALQEKTKLNEKILGWQTGIKRTIEELKSEVFKPLESMTEIMQSVDFLATMHNAGAITDRMILSEIEKYKGNESAMVYFREKMKNAGVSTYHFDNNMFSEYQTDINGDTVFVAPTNYFEALERTITGGNDLLITHALGQTEQIIGVESEGLKNYITEVSQNSTPNPVVY